MFISDAFMTNFVLATDEILGAASLFGAGLFANALSAVGTGGLAVERYVEVDFFGGCKEAVRRVR